MVIRDLEHQEVISQRNKLEGGLASLTFNLEFLSLGTLVSVADITTAEFLTTETPGVNISSGKFSISMQAVGVTDFLIGLAG